MRRQEVSIISAPGSCLSDRLWPESVKQNKAFPPLRWFWSEFFTMATEKPITAPAHVPWDSHHVSLLSPLRKGKSTMEGDKVLSSTGSNLLPDLSGSVYKGMFTSRAYHTVLGLRV